MADTKNENIKIIKNFIKTQNLPNLTDEQIILFTFSCQNNPQATKEKIVYYFALKKRNPEIFNDWNIEREDVKLQSRTLKFCVFPKKTDDECLIFFVGLRDTSYRNYEQAPSFKLMIMTLEAAIVDQNPKGLIFLVDMEGTGLMHMIKTKLNLQKLFLKYILEASPVKLKSIHMLNCVYFMDKFISIVKPLIDRQVYESIHFHSSNMDKDNFYANHIPQKCLPQEYGGYLSSIEDLHAENIRKLGDMKLYFQTKEEQLRKWNHEK